MPKLSAGKIASDDDILRYASALDLPEMAAHEVAPAKKGGFFESAASGISTSFKQLPQLAYGLGAIGAAGLESMAGEGGLATAMKQGAVDKYLDWSKKIRDDSSENYEWDTSYNKAKAGDIGALVDFLGYGVGYGLGQGAQILATAGVGGIAAKTVGREAVERVASGMVAKEATELAAKNASLPVAQRVAASEINKLAVANVATRIGQNAAIGASAFGMEGGEIGGDLVAENRDRELTGSELVRALGATTIAGGLEFVGDRIGLGALTGKLGVGKGMAGIGGRSVRAGTGALAAAPGEFATEYMQTGVENWGKGKEDSLLTWQQSEASQREAINAGALGAVGGGTYGAIGGVLSNPRQDAAPAQDSTVPESPVQGAKPEADTRLQGPAANPPAASLSDIASAGSVEDAVAAADAIVSAPATTAKDLGMFNLSDIEPELAATAAPDRTAGLLGSVLGTPAFTAAKDQTTTAPLTQAPTAIPGALADAADASELSALIDQERADKIARLATEIARMRQRNQSENASAVEAAQSVEAAQERPQAPAVSSAAAAAQEAAPSASNPAGSTPDGAQPDDTQITPLGTATTGQSSSVAPAIQQAASKAKSVRSGPPPNQRRDDLVGAILRVTGGSGVSPKIALDILGEKANRPGAVRGLFTNAGTVDLGDIARLLRDEEGHYVRDGNHLSDLIRQQSDGEPVYSMARTDEEIDKAKAREHRDRVIRQAKKYGIKTAFVKFDSIEEKVIKALEDRHAAAVAILDKRSKERYDRMLKKALEIGDYDAIDAIMIDVESRLSGREMQNETTRQLRGYIDDLIARKNGVENDGWIEEGSSTGPAWLEDGDGRRAEESGGRGAADRGDQTAASESFGLEGQSAREVAEQEAQRRSDEEASAKAAAQEVADRKAAAKKSADEALKARAANPDNFRFGEGSRDAAKPMGSLFDQPSPGLRAEATGANRQSFDEVARKPEGVTGAAESRRDNQGVKPAGANHADDFATRPDEITERLVSTGNIKALHKAAGVKTSDAFSDLPMDERSKAYAKYVEDGGQPAPPAAEDYNDKIARMEREALVRRLQSDATVRQANGNPFKTEASAKEFSTKHDLDDTHEAVKVEAGYVLKRLPEARRPSVLKAVAERQANDPENIRQEAAFARAEKIGAAASDAIAAYENGDTSIEQFEAALDAAEKVGASETAANEAVTQADAIAPEQVDVELLPTTPAQASQAKAQESKIGDMGRKVIVRKDTATATGPRSKTANTDERPAWIRKYHVMQDKNGKWEIMEDAKSSLKGAVKRVSYDRYATEQEAWDALPLVVAAKRHRAYSYTDKAGQQQYGIFRSITDRKRAMVKGGFSTANEAMAYIAAHPVEIIEHKFPFPERPWLDKIERTGKDYRKGKNVTKQMFEDTFAPGAVVYGNWLLNADGAVNADGQELSNFIYDALRDLADAINVPPKALFLNGELALGIGADGKGGKNSAAAHYDPNPGKILINLTKIKGAGSAAHEWWHAVDHYFARQGGYKDSASVVAGDFPRDSEARPELVAAIKQVVDTMMHSTKSQTTDADVVKERAQKRVDEAIKNLDYYARDLRSTLKEGRYNKGRKVATEAQLQQWDAMVERLKAGDMGEKVYIDNPSKMRDAFGFETGAVLRDMNALYKAVTGRSFLRQDPESTGRRMHWVAQSIKENLERTTAEQDETRTYKGRTDYYLEAKQIDNYRTGDYWSMPEELGARAFESYIFDKLTGTGERSDYLVYAVENRHYAALGMKPYPEGDERQAINAAFDKLFETVQTKETDAGVAMFSRSAPAANSMFPELQSSYEVPASRKSKRALDGEELRDLRRAAARIESPDRGITFFVDIDGRAIVTGPARTKVPDRFRRFAEENGLTLVVRRAPSGGAARGPAMPELYRESGALYFAELPSHRHDDRTGLGTFSRGSGSGIDIGDLRAIVSRAQRRFRNLPEIHVLESPDQAPKALRDHIRKAGAWNDVEGATYEGEIFLFASGIADEARAEHVLVTHEITHYGLRGAIGNSLDGALQSIFTNNQKVRIAAAQKREALGLGSNLMAVEEVLADMPGAELVRLKGWRKLVAAVRNWLDRIGATALADRLDAMAKIGLSGQERADLYVADLVTAAREWVRTGRRAAGVERMTSGSLVLRDGPALSREKNSGGTRDASALDDPLFVDPTEFVDDEEAFYEAVIDKAKQNGKRVFFHRSDSPTLTTVSDESSDGKANFGGLFALGFPSEGAQGQYGGYLYEIITPESITVASGNDVAGALSSGGYDELLEKYASNTGVTLDDSGNIEALREVVANGSDRFIGEDEAASWLDPDPNTAQWVAQEVRARVAKSEGFGAIQEEDGILIFPGKDVSLRLSRLQPDGVIIPLNEPIAQNSNSEDARLSRTPPLPGTQPAAQNRPTQGAMPVGGAPAPNPGWKALSPSVADSFIYELQNKQIDLKRTVASIKEAVGTINEAYDAEQAEELYHARRAERIKDFLENEEKPLIEEMRMRGVSIPELEAYLWARTAKETNAYIATLENGMQDGGSGLTNQEVNDYYAGRDILDANGEVRVKGLDWSKRTRLDALAKRIDGIVKQNRQLLVDYQLESAGTVKTWEQTYPHYVPLQRDGMENPMAGPGIGQGFSIKGSESRRRTGSAKDVVDIIGNLMEQRARIVSRGEKNRVAQALYGLAKTNPNPELWTTDRPQKEKVIERINGKDTVVSRISPTWKNRAEVVVAKFVVNGKTEERAVIFEKRNPRALRMAEALKNLDADDLGHVLSVMAKGTRYFAAVNTQYNPIFGIINFIRDLQTGVLNLSSTPLKGRRAELIKNVWPALRGISSLMRGNTSGYWANLYEQFRLSGGVTGYTDMFSSGKEHAEALQSMLTPTKWQMMSRSARENIVMRSLSAYNTTLENAVRLAAFKAGIDSGLSPAKSASIAKNLTVNFNRKGRMATQLGAGYAFFNAAVQGMARMKETMWKDGKITPAGAKILAGGVMVGVAQAFLLSLAGFGDDDPPEFVRERNLIIPIGNGKFATLPMPLGFHAIPNIGRVTAEWMLDGFRNPAKHFASLSGVFADAFNPLGSSTLLQTLSPTVLDPVVALGENRDWTGKSIAKLDRDSLNQTPGYTRARDTSSLLAKSISYALNIASGGTDYKPGLISPTPDQIDYLAGQVGGGVWRELSKLEQTATASVTGEELPPHKIPLVGRFYGDSTGNSGQSAAFYAALERINGHELELKGLRKDGKTSEAISYLRENPESMLIAAANAAENKLGDLRRAKRELLEKGDMERVRMIEEQMTDLMSRFNDRVKAAESRRKADQLRDKPRPSDLVA